MSAMSNGLYSQFLIWSSLIKAGCLEAMVNELRSMIAFV